MDAFSRIRQLDAYPKVNEDFYKRTLSGGIITILATFFMVVLFFSELRLFLTTRTENSLFVDTSRGEMMQINVNITFPHMACAYLSLDAMDVSGENHLDVVHNVYKQRLDPDGKKHVDPPEKHKVSDTLKISEKKVVNGTECGSCYGAEEVEHQCCNTCDEVREAYRKKGWGFANPEIVEQCVREGFVEKMEEQRGEGCSIFGHLEVSKVAGNVHFAPGKSFQANGMHIHDLAPFHGMEFNVSHIIHALSFGEDFPGVVHPLDGVKRPLDTYGGMYQYFVKVVPTSYRRLRGKTIQTNQYAVTEHYKPGEPGGGGRSLPGVFIFYDMSPIKVIFTEVHNSFFHFLTNVCAIVGGVFTVSGIVSSFVYHGHKALAKKVQLGKFS